MALTSVNSVGSLTSTHAVFEWLEIHALCTRQLNLCMVRTATVWDQILHHQSLSALHQCDPCCVRNAKFPLALKEKRPCLTKFVHPSFHGFSHKKKIITGGMKCSQSVTNPLHSIQKTSFCIPTNFLSWAFFFTWGCRFLTVYARCLHNSRDRRWSKYGCVINLISFIYWEWIDLCSVLRIGFNFLMYKADFTFLYEKLFLFFVLPHVMCLFCLCFICVTSFHSHGMYSC